MEATIAQLQQIRCCRLKEMRAPSPTMITVPFVWESMLLAMKLPLLTKAATSFIKPVLLIGYKEKTAALVVVADS